MKRRHFIQTAGKAVTLPILLNGMKLSAMSRSAIFKGVNNDSDRVLILIQLNGGNDGLNMVIPRDQYSGLSNVRPNILIPETAVLPLNDLVGVHPVMTGVKSMFEEGKLGIVQAAGYPNQNRSHFRSTDIWTSGSPAEQFWTTGWLGRYMDGLYPGFPDNYPNDEYPDPFAITMGNVVSETCQGVSANFSLTLNDPFNLLSLYEGEPGELPDTPYGEELSFLRTAIAQSNAYSQVVETAATAGANLVEYPADNRLAQQLKNVALLISGGLRTKVYVVSLGGFDTHANQVDIGDPTAGDHAQLLETLSQAMAVFQADLMAQGIEEKVVGMTFSEFGRRIRSNDSLGTDHGTAAPLMVFGSCVNAQVLGENPEIPTDVDVQEGIPMQYDFRDIYGSILMDWFEVPEADVKSLLHEGFTHLPILEVCSPVSTANPVVSEEIRLTNFPNPFRESTIIEFYSKGEQARLSIFNSMGAELEVLVDKKLPEGVHQVEYRPKDLPAGNYYYRLQLDGRFRTRRFVKI